MVTLIGFCLGITYKHKDSYMRKINLSISFKNMMRHSRIYITSIVLFNFMVSAYAVTNNDYTLFEVDPVRPVVSLNKSGFVAALNIPDDYLELFKTTHNGLKHCASVKVGMRPVSMAVINETSSTAKIWVVNQLSDSISVVKLNLKKCKGTLTDTILVGDEPRDIVVANTRAGKRIFVSMAHRGQNHPDPLVRTGKDLIRTSVENTAINRPAGLADVVVYNANNPKKFNIINLFTDTPRALTLGAVDDKGFHQQVFAAGFHTGNKTSVIAAETARGHAVEHLQHLMAHGDVVESSDGELIVAKKNIKMHGGTPAVIGKGRCMPDPRPEKQRRHELQMCVETDEQHNLIAFRSQVEGMVDQRCSCSNSAGEIQPVISTMIKFYGDKASCGINFDSDIEGCWLDKSPEDTSNTTPAMAWNDAVKYTLPDDDVFKLDIKNDGQISLAKSYSGVGTVIFGMATHPKSGKVYVVNQDANNLTRYEGLGHFADTSVRGNIAQSQISILNGNSVDIKNLNDHINTTNVNSYAKTTSLAFPVAVEITSRKNKKGQFKANQNLYFVALGSDKLAYISTKKLESAEVGAVNSEIKHLTLSKWDYDKGEKLIAGPVGLTFNDKQNQLYILTRFTNELLVVDLKKDNPKVLSRHSMHNPESKTITDGRSVLYYAPEMSDNGDQSCASCHIYSNHDSLAWDLGNPDIQSVNNPGPLISAPLVGFVSDLAIDPEQSNPYHKAVNPDFRSNKGPMLTLPLRGLSNHGAMHWRGDRVRKVQNTYGEHPNTGPMDERNSIGEFDEAVTILTGNDQPLDDYKMDALADYLLKITYPPNPIRELSNNLKAQEESGRAAFYGCKSMTDKQLENRVCIGTNDELVDIDFATQECECFGNPMRFVMQRLTKIQAFAATFSTIELVVSNRTPAEILRIEKLQAMLNNLKPLAEQVSVFERNPLSSFAVSGNRAAYNSEAQVYSEYQLSTIQDLVVGNNYPQDSSGILGFVAAVKAAEQELNISILPSLLSQLELTDLTEEQAKRLGDPEQVTVALAEWFGDANVSRTALLDAQLTAGQESNPLRGCGLNKTAQSCPLRIADSLTTCQGCHVLDEKGNGEFGIEFPGFFGTKGDYAFSNIPQVLKVPHLRNLYSRVGKFGQPYEFDMFVGQSVFGLRKGGFFDRKTPLVGPSVRGYGFSHDGSADTLHRFSGLLDFFKRPAGTLGPDDVRGNPDALDAFVPADPAACLATVAQGGEQFFNQLGADKEQMTQVALAAISGDEVAAGQIVQTVLTSPAMQQDTRWQAIAGGVIRAMMSGQEVTKNHGAPIVEAVAASLLCPNVPSDKLMPLCFQLGSAMESGAKDGICYPTGLTERDAVESFMLTFDTNLKPMVGQQVTLNHSKNKRFNSMVVAAAAGHCDIGGWRQNKGYLMIEPNIDNPMQSLLLSDRDKTLTVESLFKRKSKPITFTCYPPQANQAEARRSVIDRDIDGILNGLDKDRH